MNIRHISQSEIAERQLQVRLGAYRARHAFSISGIRQLIGNTIIALGTQVSGNSQANRTPMSNPVSATASGD